jgi:preprotein translocase subunit SecG
VKLLLYFVYYLVCMFLVIVVLLQHGKGADIGVSLGAGSSNTVFGARGAGNFLTKLTTGSAILFMVLAFGLARCAPETTSDDLLAAPPASSSEAPAAEKAPAAETPAEGEAKPPAPGETPAGFEAVEPPKPAAPAPAPAQPAKP